jgi:hypothetical protein
VPSVWNYDSSWYGSGDSVRSGSSGAQSGTGSSDGSGDPEEFVVVDTSDPQGVTVDNALRLYGPPATEYRGGRWTVLVYDSDILGSVHVP